MDTIQLGAIDLALPVTDMVVDDLCCRIHGKVPANGFNKVAFGIWISSLAKSDSLAISLGQKLTHQVEVNAVIYQIILPRLDILRRRKVHPIRLARALDLIVRPRQAQNILMKVR